jgi:hypothetical protein
MTGSTSEDDLFRVAFQRYGAPWRDESDSRNAVVTVLLDLFRWAVKAQKRTIGSKGPTYCDIIENPSFNALATTYKGHDFVTLLSGAINYIFSVYFTFLSDPNTLPTLGDPSSHATPPDAIDAIRAGRTIYTTEHVPKDKQRVDAAHEFGVVTCLVVLLHEVGHIVWGHPLFLQRKYGLDVYEEIAPSKADQRQLDIRMAFEWEADDYAADASYQLSRHMFDAGSFRALRDFPPDLVWSIATSMAFLLIAHMGGGDLTRKSPTHPRPIHRSTSSMLSVLRSKRCQPFSPDETCFQSGFQEVAKWFRRNDINIHFSERSESQLREFEIEYQKAKRVLRDELTLLEQIQSERRRGIGVVAGKKSGCQR